MSSIKKKNKLKNSFMCKSGLKHKGKGMKRLVFFTSAQRKLNNKIKYEIN